MNNVCVTCGRYNEGPRHVCVKPFAFDTTMLPGLNKCPHRIAIFSSHVCDHAPSCDCRRPGFCREMPKVQYGAVEVTDEELKHVRTVGCALCDVDPDSSPSVRAAVAWLAKVARLLLEKNRKYKDSAASPLRIFSRSDALEGIKVRIDDKLSRIQNRANDEDEDVVADLAGYLAFLATLKK